MDQYHDPCNQELVKFASELKLPEEILKADLNKDAIEKLASSKFAWPEARMFPVHTPEDSLISTVYFLNKKSSLGSYAGEIENRLHAAVIAHNIEEPYLDILRQKGRASIYKEATSQNEFALSHGSSGVLPLNDENELLRSADELEKNAHLLGSELSKEASRNIAEKAEYFGVDLEDYPTLRAYCGERGIDFEKAAELMLYRAKRAPTSFLQEAMVKMAQSILILPELDIEFEKVAEFIDEFDKTVGTDKLVRRGTIPDGYNTIFNSPLMTKSAGVTLAGCEYTESDFKALPMEKWSEALGEDFIKAAKDRHGNFSIDQAMNIAATLPLPDARILSEYIEGNK